MTEEEISLATRYFNLVLQDESQKEWYALYSGSLSRTNAHDALAKVLDVDRALISELIERVRLDNFRPEPIGIDFNAAFDDFITGLDELRKLPSEQRHKVIQVSESDLSGLDEIPNIILVNSTIKGK